MVVCFSTAASAQAPSTNGIKIGEGRLHPFFDLELRFDSAAGFFGTSTPGVLALRPEAIAHFRPGLKLEYPSSMMDLNFSGNLDYVFYTGLLTPGSSSASRLEGGLNLDAAFNRKGVVELTINDHLNRSDRTNNPAASVGVLSFFNQLKIGVPIRPGGGALEFTPHGAWAVELFQPFSSTLSPGCADVTCDPSALAGMNYNNFRFGLDARWRFLPKTAVIFESSFDTRQYANPAGNLPPLLLKAQAGIAGLVSPKISLTAKVGWGHDLAASGAKTVLGMAELAYLLNEASNVRVGYLRQLEPVPTFGVYGDDRAYLDARFLFFGRLALRGYVAYDYLTFYANSGRSDSNVTANIGPEYQFTPWLIGAVGYDLGFRNSNATSAGLNFTRHEAYARLTFTY